MKRVIGHFALFGKAGENREPTDFAREGDRILWIVWSHERPDHPLLEVLHQLENAEAPSDPGVSFTIQVLAWLSYLLAPSNWIFRQQNSGRGW